MSKMREEIIVDKIIDDIDMRKGLGDEWEAIEPEIQEEIKEAWLNIMLDEPNQ